MHLNRVMFFVNLGILILFSVFTIHLPVRAEETAWRRPDHQGDWFDSSNWSAGRPEPGDDVYIGKSGTAHLDGNETDVRHLWVGTLSFFEDPPTPGHLLIRGGEMMAERMRVSTEGSVTLERGMLNARRSFIVGFNRGGTYHQSGGTLSTFSMGVGHFEQRGGMRYEGHGTFHLAGGEVMTENFGITGVNSPSHFVQEGGAMNSASLIISAWGDYQLYDGRLNVDRTLFVNENGKLLQQGGTIETVGINIESDRANLPAEYEIDNGSITTLGFFLNGDSSFARQRGGQVTVTTVRGLPDPPRLSITKNGSYLQTGGRITAERVDLGDRSSGTALFEIAGGMAEFNTVNIADPRGFAGANGRLAIKDPAAELNVAELNVAVAPDDLSLGEFVVESSKSRFRITREATFGRNSRYAAASGTTMELRAANVTNRSIDGTNLSGFANTTWLVASDESGEPDANFFRFEAAGNGAGIGAMQENFGVGALVIPTDLSATIAIQNDFDNLPNWDGAESLYFEHIDIGPGATVTFTGDSNIFFKTAAIHPTATVIEQGVQLLSLLTLIGDFDRNGSLDVDDLQALVNAIGTAQAAFDLNGSGSVETDDLAFWVHDVKNTYFGDANLDGLFDSSDLVMVFKSGEYEDDLPGNSTWSTGDWNADGEFDTSDMVHAFQDGGFERGPRPAQSVPEPATPAAPLILLAVVFGGRVARPEKNSEINRSLRFDTMDSLSVSKY